MKTIFESKTNWVAFITIVIGALTSAQQLEMSPEHTGQLLSVIGVLTLILRTFFTSVPIAK